MKKKQNTELKIPKNQAPDHSRNLYKRKKKIPALIQKLKRPTKTNNKSTISNYQHKRLQPTKNLTNKIHILP